MNKAREIRFFPLVEENGEVTPVSSKVELTGIHEYWTTITFVLPHPMGMPVIMNVAVGICREGQSGKVWIALANQIVFK